MTQQEKDSIREALRVYAAKYSSQKKPPDGSSWKRTPFRKYGMP